MSTLSCEQIRERLADGDEDEALHAHARSCPDCAPVLAALSEIDAELAALPPIDAPDALVVSTLAQVQAPDDAASPASVGTPSLLAAAFAMLTTAVGALLTAPLVALRWLLGVGSARAASGSLEDRGKTPTRPVGWLTPTLALGSVLIGIVGLATFSTLGATVKTKVRGAEAVVNGLPTTSTDDEAEEATGERDDGRGWFELNMDRPNAPEPAPAAAATDWAGRPSSATPTQDVALDLQQAEQLDLPAAGDRVTTQSTTLAWAEHEEDRERGEAGGDITRELAGGVPGPTSGDTTVEGELGLEVNGRFRTLGPEGPSSAPTRTPAPDLGAQGLLGGGRDQTADGDDDGIVRDGMDVDELTETLAAPSFIPPTPAYWELAQATSGLTFASSQSWWANTYVPGDARLRVLHARLAASPSPLAGGALSALALAETATPTIPAVAAPTDRALAIGVHADTTAIEGPTRVRMEIALRAIDQAAGRRGALRIAIVVDARSGLGTEESAHLRALLASLSRSLSPRDRVVLTAAGTGGGTLVPLGVLRHGQVEVALRHLAAPAAVDGTTISLEDALGAGLEAVAVDDDGAGLALLVTPDGSHDAGVDQALHLGAVAGVPTTAVGIGTAASTASLDAIALAGEGRRRVVLSDDDATRAVREEVSAASRLVARALRVRIRLADGVQLVDVVGSHALDAEETRRTRESERAIDQELARRLGIGQDRDEDDSGVRVLVPSFYAGDSHTIVLDLLVSRPGPVADVDVRFKDLVRLGNGTASSALALEAGTAPRGPHELRVVASFVGHEVAGALDEAADRIEAGDVAGARARLAEVRALIDQARASVEGLGSVSSIRTDATLLDRFLAAIDTASDRGLVASSLHYAAARRIVIPQLQASVP